MLDEPDEAASSRLAQIEYFYFISLFNLFVKLLSRKNTTSRECIGFYLRSAQVLCYDLAITVLVATVDVTKISVGLRLAFGIVRLVHIHWTFVKPSWAFSL